MCPNIDRHQCRSHPADFRRALRSAGRGDPASRAERRVAVDDRDALRREHCGDRGTQRPRPSLSNSSRPGAGVARRPWTGARRRGIGREVRGDAGQGAHAADRRRGHGEPLRREARRHVVEDRFAQRPERRVADGAEQHPQPQLPVRGPGAGARALRACGTAGRGGSPGRSRRGRAGARARLRRRKPPSPPPSARPKRSVRRWWRARRPPRPRIPPTTRSPKDDTVRCRPPKRSATTPNGSTCAPAHLRQPEQMSFATPVIIGRKVKLIFAKVTQDQFEARRQEYHRQLQEAFFTQFRIKGTTTHVDQAPASPSGSSRSSATTSRSGCCASTTRISISATSARDRSWSFRSSSRRGPRSRLRHEAAARRARARTCLQRLCDCAALRRPATRSGRGRPHHRRPADQRRLAADGRPASGRRDAAQRRRRMPSTSCRGHTACWSIAGLRRRKASAGTRSKSKSPPGDATDWSRRPVRGCGSAPQVTLQTVDF